jgi:uncharacterized protein YndB with AHSA1/START domain
MAAKNTKAAETEPNELVLSRVFDAPPSLVYAACIERKHTMQWMAPHGFRISHSEAEVRPGGSWRSCMVSPEGQELWLSGVYREVVPDRRLVFTHAWDDEHGKPGHQTVVTLMLEEVRGKTLLTLRQAFFASAASRDGHRGGWTQCLERLETLLKQQTGASA